MPHHRPTRSFGPLLTGLLVLSSCAINDSALEPERTGSTTTVESIDPPSTNPAGPTTTLQQESPATIEFIDPPSITPAGPTTTLPIDDTSDDAGSDDPIDGDSYLYLPKLLDSILVDHPSGQQPVMSTGDMPPSIVASTETCEIIVVDAATGETTKLWEYKYIRAETPFYYCAPLTDDIESILPPNYESGLSFSEDLEWIDTGYILISMCCEPAAGRFELLAMPAISGTEEPLYLALNGGSPDISEDGSLLFALFGSSGYPIGVIEEFDVNSDNASDPEYPRYSLTGSSSYYELSVDQEDISSGIRGFVGNVSWLNNDRIAFDLWSFDFDLPDSEVTSWTGVIDLTRQSVSLNSRSPGWSIPTGDELGNLVVAQQPCDYFVMKCEDHSRIVTVDSHTILPIHELEVDGNIADMDLVRGWLLITLTDGRMGTIDSTTGAFSFIADGITHAVWME